MSRKKILVKRLSSLTLLKVMVITFMFPWLLIDTGIILFHVLNGDYYVEIIKMTDNARTVEQIPIGKFVLLSYPLVVLVSGLLVLMFWVFAALSLYLWSQIRPMELTYYEVDRKEIKK
jgi:hypothetical protein